MYSVKFGHLKSAVFHYESNLCLVKNKTKASSLLFLFCEASFSFELHWTLSSSYGCDTLLLGLSSNIWLAAGHNLAVEMKRILCSVFGWLKPIKHVIVCRVLPGNDIILNPTPSVMCTSLCPKNPKYRFKAFLANPSI